MSYVIIEMTGTPNPAGENKDEKKAAGIQKYKIRGSCFKRQ